MAEVIWTEPAFDQLNEIAEYIALDKPGAASTLVEKVLSAVEHLQLVPEAGHVPPELPQSVYRELYDFENRGSVRAGLLNISVPGGFEPEMPGISAWFLENPPGKPADSLLPPLLAD